MKINTVATLLNKHKEEVYEPLNSSNTRKCLEVVKELLHSEEAKDIKKEDLDRCEKTLTSSIYNTSRFLSTLVTWMTAIKIGN